MILLRTHFDGPGEVEKRIAHANNDMESLHYRKESIFPFLLVVRDWLEHLLHNLGTSSRRRSDCPQQSRENVKGHHDCESIAHCSNAECPIQRCDEE